VSIPRMHFFGASGHLPEKAFCDRTLVWVQVTHFCYKLDRINFFAYCVTFCNRRSAALSLLQS